MTAMRSRARITDFIKATAGWERCSHLLISSYCYGEHSPEPSKSRQTTAAVNGGPVGGNKLTDDETGDASAKDDAESSLNSLSDIGIGDDKNASAPHFTFLVLETRSFRLVQGKYIIL